MDGLPLDLLRPIVEHLKDDIRSLLAISLASPTLREEGQRILFRTVALYGLNNHIKFFTAVTSSGKLAPLVEEYEQLGLVDAEFQQEPLWGLTCRGLQAMVNLKILLFHAFHGLPSTQILHGCTFQLEVFGWASRDAELLVEFLLTQPHLHTLMVDWKVLELNTSSICPGLQALHGNRNTITAFLPGRHITSLKWSPDEKESLLNRPIDHLPQECGHIRFFSFGGLWGRPRFDLVMLHFRALEVLRLIGLYSHEVCLKKLSLQLCFSLTVPCSQDLQSLSEIPRLRIFILSKSPRSVQNWRGPVSLKSRIDFFPQLFATCNALQRIDINTHARMYQRWFRDAHPRRYIYISEVYVLSDVL